MVKDYKARDIKVLDEISHIRLNAGMYISNTETPTHLIEEALDNSLDEALSGFATQVSVNVDTKTHIYSVTDNGRGIPIDNDVPIIISNKLFSGAKFQDSKTAYNICSGLHGIGLVAINALSEKYEIDIYRDKKHANFRFENSRFKEKTIKKFEGTPPFSTRIKFKPDKKIFQSLDLDVDRIRRRLLVATIELPNCTLVLDIDGVQDRIKLTKSEYFRQRVLNGDAEVSSIIDISTKEGIEEFNCIFAYSFSGTITPKMTSSVNLLPVDSGGTHVNIFMEILREFFVTRGKKAGLKFQPNDSLCGLRAYLSLELVKPEFSGQAKEKLINRKDYLLKLTTKLKQSIDSYFIANPKDLENILLFFDDYRRKIDSKKVSGNGGSKKFSTKFTKLRDCTATKGGELFIVEGDSAAGSLIQSRDPKVHAIFPLKGKIPSIATSKDILKNVEIGELISALGTGVGPHFDIAKLKYNKVVCCCDADSDGGHIFCLLTIALANLVPEIIKRGHYYLARTPLYAVNDKKTFIPLWNEKELEKAKTGNKRITRFKGLGELNPWQMKLCALDEKTRHLVKVGYTTDMNKLMKLFSDSQVKRLLLDGKDC